jgi:hypothetical protein
MRAENAAWQKAKFSEVMKEIHEENYVKIMREMKAKEEQENQWRAAAAKNNPVTVVNLPENKGEVK